jgi:hypothetical protein
MKIDGKSWKVWAAGIAAIASAFMASGALFFYVHGPMREMSPEHIAWMTSAAEGGDYEIGGKLSWLYERGWGGIKKDYAEAYFLNSIAVTEVVEDELVAAREHAADDAEHLTPEQKAAVDKRVSEWVKAHPALLSTKRSSTASPPPP